MNNTEVRAQCIEEYFLGLPCKVDFGYELTAADFSKIEGSYQTSDGKLIMKFMRRGHYVFVETQGRQHRLRAKSATSFEFVSVDAGLRFFIAENPSQTKVMLLQDGQKAELSRK